jgi:hypothetical protein
MQNLRSSVPWPTFIRDYCQLARKGDIDILPGVLILFTIII